MNPSEQWSRLQRVLLIGFLVLLMGACGLLILGSVTHDTGVVGFLIGISLALLPLPVVIGAFRWLDRYEPEPRGLLLFAFFWGATVAALAAALLNTASLIAIARTSGGSGMDVTAVLVAPWVEEAAKGAAVLLVLVFRRREFDGVVDGIVLAGLSAVGFAFTENILYFGRAFLAGQEREPDHRLLRRRVHLRAARGDLAVRAPAVHGDDRHRAGHRGPDAPTRRPGGWRRWPASCSPYCSMAPGTCRRCPGCPASSPATC